MTTAHSNLTCDCSFVIEAREAYEASSANLRRHTIAAWVRWEEMPIDGRLRWMRRLDEPVSHLHHGDQDPQE